MPRIRLSNTTVGELPVPTTNTYYRDEQLPGFGLVITPKGVRSYFIEKRINGRNRRLTIGRHGQVTQEQARRKAQQLLAEIAMGSDPVAERQDRRVESVTLREVYRDYLNIRRKLKPNTLHDYKRCVEGTLSDWLDQSITRITRDRVQERHAELGRQSQARANNTMRVLRALLNFAMNHYQRRDGSSVLPLNPVDRLSESRAWYRLQSRQIVLTPSQLKPWFKATLKLRHEVTRDYLHFLLFTGLRRSEATNLTWDNVNLADRTFVIPDTKNREPHWLPMSDFLFDLLSRRHKRADGQWVFPSPFTDGPLKEPRTALKKVTELSGITFTLHDLRRTFITIAESQDIPAYALKRLLNHRFSNDVTGGYIVSGIEHLRDQMQRISDYILSQVED